MLLSSHITRHITINWSRSSLLNLVVRRAIYNKSIAEMYSVTDELAHKPVSEQESFFYRLCPDQVDVGQNKPMTFDWLLTRTRDGSQHNAPRELIHFLNSLREVQIKRLELNEPDPEGKGYLLALRLRTPCQRSRRSGWSKPFMPSILKRSLGSRNCVAKRLSRSRRLLLPSGTPQSSKRRQKHWNSSV